MKLRTPGTLSAAIDEIKNKLTQKECAKLLGRSESLIRKWVDPDDPALPNLRQCLVLDAAYLQAGLGEPPIQNWYIQRLGRIANDDPKDVGSIILSTLQAQAAIGQLASLIAELTKRGGDTSDDLSSNERAVMLGLITNLSDNLDRLEEAIQEKLDIPGPVALSKVLIK